MSKILGVLIILAAGALAFFAMDDGGFLKSSLSQQENAPCIQLTPADQFIQMVNNDFQTLLKNGELPEEWKQIATIQARMSSSLAKALMGKKRPHFERVKDGTTYLELEFMDLPDETNPGVIIQASLFDIKSQNKIFEIGRTYTMEDLNKENVTSDEDQNSQ